jgi:hypothetical protein
MTISECYSNVSSWLKVNKHKIPADGDYDALNVLNLIESLPSPADISDVEMYAVLKEILVGYLAWAQDCSDGTMRMVDYYQAANEFLGGDESDAAIRIWARFQEEVSAFKSGETPGTGKLNRLYLHNANSGLSLVDDIWLRHWWKHQHDWWKAPCAFHKALARDTKGACLAVLRQHDVDWRSVLNQSELQDALAALQHHDL